MPRLRSLLLKPASSTVAATNNKNGHVTTNTNDVHHALLQESLQTAVFAYTLVDATLNLIHLFQKAPTKCGWSILMHSVTVNIYGTNMQIIAQTAQVF